MKDTIAMCKERATEAMEYFLPAHLFESIASRIARAYPSAPDFRKSVMQFIKYTILAMVIAVGRVGCARDPDAAVDQKLAEMDVQEAKHPHYPIHKQVDFGDDDGPFSMIAYGNYGYVNVDANERIEVSDASGTSEKVAKAIALAIAEVQKIEKESPAPSKPPTAAMWLQVPHPALGTYAVKVSTGLDLQGFTVSTSSGQAVEADSPQVRSVADQIVAALVKNQNAVLASSASSVPPAGFSVMAKEAMTAFGAARGRGPVPILKGANRMILPCDPLKVTAGLKRSVIEAATRLHDAQPDRKTATIQVEGPNGLTQFAVPLGSGQARAIDAGLVAITSWLRSTAK